ncbi:MAG TPA: hypothetical protein VHZ09_10960 [Acidobacteriaceae bacterium]|jgi:hypothetical protein|nr:hypothetical protein [Acidobacteriaceae bacterium]
MNAKFFGLALTSALLAAAMASAQDSPGSALTEKNIPAPAPVSTIRPTPDRPAEMPPKPPTITCRGGELTVVAENSTLGSILTAVQGCIGIRFDVPADSREERTFVHLGPAPVPAVLRSLLESSGDDFVIEPSASNPDAIQSVILIARAKTDDRGDPSSESRTLTAARRAWLDERRTTRTPAAPAENSGDPSGDLSADNQSPAEALPAENPASAPAAGADNADVAPAAVQPPAPSPATAPAPDASTNATDTNGQLQGQITSMQQLFQQRQQMIQGPAKPQSPAASSSPQ